jgi:16S rRNA C1402 N4-methylase RsmH
MKNKGNYPPGWDEARVRRVLAHYEEQSEEEAIAEDEAAFENKSQTAMEVPVELVPVVREMIAKHKTKSGSSRRINRGK